MSHADTINNEETIMIEDLTALWKTRMIGSKWRKVRNTPPPNAGGKCVPIGTIRTIIGVLHEGMVISLEGGPLFGLKINWERIEE